MATKSRKVTTKMKKNSIRKQKCTDRTIQCFWGMRISSIVQNERCKTDERGRERVCRAVLRWDNCPHNTS